MKKIPIACAAAMVCAALLAGCTTAETPEPAVSSQSVTTTSQIQSEAAADSTPSDRGSSTQSQGDDHIGEERAAEIAKTAANVTDGTVTQNNLDMDDGVWVYQVDLVSGTTKYEFEIDAATGAIREQSQEEISTGDAAANISAAEAEKIARESSNLSGGTVVKNQLDTDDGRQIYEIEIVKDGIEYSYEIDAANGTIIEQSYETQD